MQSTLDIIKGFPQFGFVIPDHDGMQNITRMKFLFDAVKRFAPNQSGLALEIGCYLGGSTVFLTKAAVLRGIKKVYAIDLFTGTAGWNQTFDSYKGTEKRLKSYGLDLHVELIRGDSRTIAWSKEIDVLHIDGDHSYEGVKSDLDRFSPFVTEGGIIIMDDYDRGHQDVVRATHEFLAKNTDFAIVAANYGDEFGSICLKRNVRSSH